MTTFENFAQKRLKVFEHQEPEAYNMATEYLKELDSSFLLKYDQDLGEFSFRVCDTIRVEKAEKVVPILNIMAKLNGISYCCIDSWEVTHLENGIRLEENSTGAAQVRYYMDMK